MSEVTGVPKYKKRITPPKSSGGNQPLAVIEKGKVIHLPSAPVSQIDKLIEMALDKNLDLDRLEKLMAMKKEEELFRARKAYYSALSEFQHKVPKIVKNINVNYEHKDKKGETDYDYADLDQINDTIKEPMYANGLTHSWDHEENDKEGKVSVVCIITHVDGHQERSNPLSGPFDTSGNKGPIHSKASTLSYLRRYTLTGILGLTSAESDDDGRRGDRVRHSPSAEASSTSKVKFDDAKMNNAVEMILAGTKTVDQIKEQAELTEEQEKALRKTEENYLKNLRPAGK